MAIAPPTGTRGPQGKGRRKIQQNSNWGFWAAIICVVAVFGGVLWFMLANRVNTDDADSGTSRKGQIAAVDPSLSSNGDGSNWATETQAHPDGGIGETANAVEAATNAPAATSNKPKNFRIVKPNNRGKKLFHNISDIHISRLVNATPGRAMIGTMNYDRFAEQFKKSLDTPIVIEEDDTPEEVAAKQNVIETREELKRMLENGDDLAQVMRETESELRRLYNYRQNLSKELAQAFREKKFSADDMQDYIDAANKMLKDNDMEPLKHPEFWVRQLRMLEATGE